MIVLYQIHGGTSENDVIKKVKAAEEMAEKNKSTYTVLFFDEANTSDAIGLIKEVMCDRRVYGRSIRSDVKFIAACNPYRKLDVLFRPCFTIIQAHRADDQ